MIAPVPELLASGEAARRGEPVGPDLARPAAAGRDDDAAAALAAGWALGQAAGVPADREAVAGLLLDALAGPDERSLRLVRNVVSFAGPAAARLGALVEPLVDLMAGAAGPGPRDLAAETLYRLTGHGAALGGRLGQVIAMQRESARDGAAGGGVGTYARFILARAVADGTDLAAFAGPLADTLDCGFESATAWDKLLDAGADPVPHRVAKGPADRARDAVLAVRWLSAAGARLDEFQPPLAAALAHARPTVRAAAQEVAAAADRSSDPAARTVHLLTAPDVADRRAAIGALHAARGGFDPGILVDALVDPDPVVRFAAVDTLALVAGRAAAGAEPVPLTAHLPALIESLRLRGKRPAPQGRSRRWPST